MTVLLALYASVFLGTLFGLPWTVQKVCDAYEAVQEARATRLADDEVAAMTRRIEVLEKRLIGLMATPQGRARLPQQPLPVAPLGNP